MPLDFSPYRLAHRSARVGVIAALAFSAACELHEGAKRLAVGSARAADQYKGAGTNYWCNLFLIARIE